MAEGARLESVYRVKPIEGSNPSPSDIVRGEKSSDISQPLSGLFIWGLFIWRDGREAEGGGLLNRYTG